MAGYYCKGCGKYVDIDESDIPDQAIENCICEDCYEDEKTRAHIERD